MAQLERRTLRTLGRRFGVLGRHRVAAACVAAVVGAGAIGVASTMGQGSVLVERPEAAQETQAEPATTQEQEVLVIAHIDGAVATPGVYRLRGDDVRVQDLVEAAGGLAEDADTSTINLAAPLPDGSKVHIPAQGEEVAEAPSSGVTQTSGADATAALVNINTASVEELQALPGVGPATAAAIVEERERNGPFASPEDIMRVSGIGEKKYQKMQAMICV